MMCCRLSPLLFALVLGACLHAAAAQTPPPGFFEGFEDAASWQVITADGVTLQVRPEPGRTGQAVRLDYDFTRGSGYAIIRKEVDISLPPNYRFSYDIRGAGPSNTVEFKLIDPTGDNVWWVNQRDFQFPTDWTAITLPKRKVSFAWGPSGGAPLESVKFIEFAITSTSGGRGSVWLDNLSMDPLPEVRPYIGTPKLWATSTSKSPSRPWTIGPGGEVEWTSGKDDSRPALTIDFGQPREIGGLVLGWGAPAPPDYDILLSADGVRFGDATHIRGSNGGHDYVALPDATARAIRLVPLTADHPRSISLRSIRFMPPEFADSRNELLRTVAADAPRGWYPRYLRGEATYWTIVGVDGDTKEALMNEEGAVEVDRLAFSLEPFIFTDGKLRTWNDSANTQSLEDGYLPIPSVRRSMPGLDLEIKVFADGPAGESSLFLRYELRNSGDSPRRGTLSIALRPMQVNPPYQFLNITGGASSVRHIALHDPAIRVDDRVVVPLSPPDMFGATTLHGGEIIEYLAAGGVPAASEVNDPNALASAAIGYRFDLKPGESAVFGLLVPFHSARPSPATLQLMESRLTATRAWWRERLGHVRIRLPRGNEQLTDSLRANLAYILINRDGPGIQPGSRCYERTWIRDGALTSTALLSMGLAPVVREFLDWFAPFQYDNGKIPCCVDRRGPDPVPEHDSHGQYIYAVHTYFAHTGDREFLGHHAPRVAKAVDYIEAIRNTQMTDELASATDASRAFYGLMPASISHEGYSAKPMHSYWDDFWTIKGLSDAVRIAEALGDQAQSRRYAALRDSFQQTLNDSIRRAMRFSRIDYIPGCVELGDFDATSTTVALFPCGQLTNLPRTQLENTFDRYWALFQSRREGTLDWKDYTPYEHRIVGSMVLLGHRERALALLDYFFKDQRPAGWRHWAEVVRRAPREQAFIGDMPHTWVGSDFINSFRLMLAYTREHDNALILGAGVPRAWLETPDGVELGGLATEFGDLTCHAREIDGVVHIEVESLARPPAGGVLWSLPDARGIVALTLAGSRVDVPADGLVNLGTPPAALQVRYRRGN
ncbi:MAG TPA: discoidin domain-containing protein [Phycisphaerales bacterium]|nr:discoidin domain-containing protein [Phycisphaerales bacterium]